VGVPLEPQRNMPLAIASRARPRSSPVLRLRQPPASVFDDVQHESCEVVDAPIF